MKNFFKYIVSVLMLLSIAACNKDNPVIQEGTGVEPPEMPTSDQMTITTTVPTKIYGTPSDAISYEKSIVSRFKNVENAFNAETTRICVITSDALKSRLLTPDDYIDLYHCYMNGGVLFLTSPDVDEFTLIFQVEMCLAHILEMVTTNNMKLNGKDIDLGDIGTSFFNLGEVDESKLKDKVMYDGLGLCRRGIFICEDLDNPAFSSTKKENAEGGESSSADAIELNGYEYGGYADAAIRWLSNNLTGTKAPTIQEVMDAYTVTKSHAIGYFSFSSGQTRTHSNVVNETFRIYALHDTGAHKDYYQIDQDANFYNGLIGPVPNYEDHTSWWVGHLDGRKVFYLTHFSEWKSKLTLVPEKSDCKPNIIYAGPQAANSSTEYSTSTYHGTTSSSSNGASVNFGISLTDLFNFGGSYSATEETGTTYECQVGVSCSKQDIEILKNTTFNNNGIPSVEWHYLGNKARGYYSEGDEGDKCWEVGSLLISDMNQVNSILYEVPNATYGRARLEVEEEIWYRSCYFSSGSDPTGLGHKGIRVVYYYSIPIPEPYRSLQNWVFSFDRFGNVPNSAKMEFQKFIEEKLLPQGSSFTLKDIDDASSNAAQGVMNRFMKGFKLLNNNIKALGYGGTFSFSLKRDNGETLTASYTVQ